MRISDDEWFMRMAEVTSLRGTCIRRRVGCVLTNERKQVIATGYNGNARGLPHCLDNPCAGAAGFTEGRGLEVCEAIHAEMNAILQCRDVEQIFTCYTTTEPCITCTKLLLNTGCERVVYRKPYEGSGKMLWMGSAARQAHTWQYFP